MLKRALLLFLALALLSVPAPAAFSYYRSITIAHSQVPNTDQSSFPVLVSISGQTYLKTVANGGHVNNTTTVNGITVPADLGFYTTSGLTTKLNWEVESYDGTAGTLVAWVMISTVSHTTDTVFYMAYGDSGVTTWQGNVASTWDTNFALVSHLGDNAGNTNVTDSTSNANTGTAQQNTSSVTTTSAEIGRGMTFNGSSDYVNEGTGTQFATGSGNITLEAWVYATSLPGTFANFSIIGKGYNGTNTHYYMQLQTGGGGTTAIAVGTFNFPTNNQASVTFPGTNAWHHIVGTYDGAWNIYVDGTKTTQSVTTAPITNGTRFIMGAEDNSGGQNNFFAGRLDEVRFSSSARSADWITAEYNNESSPGTFYTVGSEIGGSSSYTASVLESFLVLNAQAGLGAHIGATRETIVVLNVNAGSGSHFAAVNNIDGLTDSRSQLGTHFAAPRDVLAAVNPGTGIGTHFATASDAMRTLQPGAGSAGHSGAASELVTVAMTSAIAQGAGRLATENVALNLTGAGVGSHFGSAKDAIQALQFPGGSAAHFGLASDLLVLSSTAASVKTAGRAAIEALALIVTGVGVGTHFGTSSDNLAPLQVGNGLGSHSRSAADLVSISELQGKASGQGRLASEGVAVLLSSASVAAHFASPSDSNGLVSLVSGSAGHFVNAAESVVSFVASASVRGLVRSATDLLVTSDIAGRLAQLNASAIELITGKHLPSRLAAHFASAGELMSILDGKFGNTFGYFASAGEFLQGVDLNFSIHMLRPTPPIDVNNMIVYPLPPGAIIYLDQDTIGIYVKDTEVTVQ